MSTPDIRLISYPGERATIVGRFWVANGADHARFEQLTLSATARTTLPSPAVNASHTLWRADDVSNGNTNICFVLGDAGGDYGRADYTTIDNSRIHNCGALPPGNHHHGIYVEASTGSVIEHDHIYGNADRGIQLYPDAQNTTIAYNVIDRNGEGILIGSGPGSPPPSGNTITHNVVSNSHQRWNIESNWAAGVGSHNSVTSNCAYASNANPYYDANGGIAADIAPTSNFAVSGNRTGSGSAADPPSCP